MSILKALVLYKATIKNYKESFNDPALILKVYYLHDWHCIFAASRY